MNTPTRTDPARLVIYALILAAIIAIGFRFGPALTTAVPLPLLLLLLVCPIMMFFMMRGMSDKPRP